MVENVRIEGRTTSDEGPKDDRIYVGVVGVTGVGKSSFCNLLSGSTLKVSDSLMSCTDTVQLAKPFTLDGREIVLIDTPGFDDTTHSQADIFKMISGFLARTYAEGTLLSGLLYFHKISDNRLGGIARQNFRLVRKLCGEAALRNMVIVTTMWDQVDPTAARKREAELAMSDLFYKPALAQGARMARYHNDRESGEEVIRMIADLHPRPFMIQQEIVDERKLLEHTEAGRHLHEELELQAQRHREELETLRRELVDLRSQHVQDHQQMEELRDAVEVMHAKLEYAENEQRKLKQGVMPYPAELKSETERNEYDRTVFAFLWWLALR